MSDKSVRPARSNDVPAMGQVQEHAWRSSLAGVLPGDVLAGLTGQDLAKVWAVAVSTPPSPRHRVLVATEESRVVGFLASAPANDPDTGAAEETEFRTLVVEPTYWGQGHGSRLLAAAAEAAEADGAQRAYAWVAAEDAAALRFLQGAGWEQDGARRTLDVRGDGTVEVEEVRLHAGLVGT